MTLGIAVRLGSFQYIHYTKIVKDIKYPSPFYVVYICYTYTYSYKNYTKKLRMFNILNNFCVVYIAWAPNTDTCITCNVRR